MAGLAVKYNVTVSPTVWQLRTPGPVFEHAMQRSIMSAAHTVLHGACAAGVRHQARQRAAVRLSDVRQRLRAHPDAPHRHRVRHTHSSGLCLVSYCNVLKLSTDTCAMRCHHMARLLRRR